MASDSSHGTALAAASNQTQDLQESGKSQWIIDSGATEHMTYDKGDFIKTTTPRRTYVANGVKYPVTSAGNVRLTKNLTLSNTLLIPSLENKLLSIGQLTEDLNYCALIYPTFYVFQDILTKEIISRGTKREGLYYVDEFTSG